MKLEIEVPEVICERCGTIGAMLPTALKRVAEGGWQPQGATMPIGWIQAPTDAKKLLCPTCAPTVTEGIKALLAPPAPKISVKTAATSIPTRAGARVTGGQRISFNPPVSRPAPTINSSSVAPPPRISARPVTSVHQRSPQQISGVVGPPKTHLPITPAERGSNVTVQANAQFLQPKTQNAQPVPQRSEPARVREVSVQDNNEIEPQGPVTATTIIRGSGV
jgi:hypothetical protein